VYWVAGGGPDRQQQAAGQYFRAPFTEVRPPRTPDENKINDDLDKIFSLNMCQRRG
jgi:hypothetical protein